MARETCFSLPFVYRFAAYLQVAHFDLLTLRNTAGPRPMYADDMSSSSADHRPRRRHSAWADTVRVESWPRFDSVACSFKPLTHCGDERHFPSLAGDHTISHFPRCTTASASGLGRMRGFRGNVNESTFAFLSILTYPHGGLDKCMVCHEYGRAAEYYIPMHVMFRVPFVTAESSCSWSEP